MKNVTIIGGGVIGICCALQLQRAGFGVTIIEREEPGNGATLASCGHIALSEVVPQSKPGTLRKIPGWLLDPKGPLTIRRASMLKLLPWMLHFAWQARPQSIRNIASGLTALTVRSLDDYGDLLSAYGLNSLIRKHPVIELYDSEAELAHERPFHALRRELGFQVREISGAEAAEIEPALATDFAHATVLEDWRSIISTQRFVTAMYDVFNAAGGNLVRADVKQMAISGGRIDHLQLSDDREYKVDQLVLAAGAWSKPLAASVGLALPVENVMGYQSMVNDSSISMKHGVIYAAKGFGITPYEDGIGVAGTIEFAGLDAKPNFERAKVLLDNARRVIPALSIENITERVGRRPFCPDTLPIIGRVDGLPNLYLATGHGQLGVTLGATTGLLVKQLLCGEKTAVDMSTYRYNRF